MARLVCYFEKLLSWGWNWTFGSYVFLCFRFVTGSKYCISPHRLAWFHRSRTRVKPLQLMKIRQIYDLGELKTSVKILIVESDRIKFQISISPVSVSHFSITEGSSSCIRVKIGTFLSGEYYSIWVSSSFALSTELYDSRKMPQTGSPSLVVDPPNH